MDPATKSGFAIGFVIVAAGLGLYAWRHGGLSLPEPARIEAPSKPEGTKPEGAKPEGASPDASKAPAPNGGESEPGASARAPQTPGAAPQTPSDTGRPAAAPDRGMAAGQGTPALGSTDVARLAPEAGPAPKPAADPRKGAFDVVRVEPSGDLVVAGRCPASCSVELLANGAPHDRAVADAGGNFSMVPPPLPPGDYQLGLRVRTPDGQEVVSEQTVTVSVPKPPSKDVVVVLNEPGAPSQVLQKPQPPMAASAAPQEAAPEPGRFEGPLTVGAVDAMDGRFFVQGSAPSGAKLRIYLNGALIAEPVAGPDGRWSLRVEKGLPPGAYALRVDRVEDEAGKVAARAEVKFAYEPQVAAAEGGKSAAPATPTAPADGGNAAGPGVPAEEAAPAKAPEARRPPPPSAPDAANPVVASLDAVTVKRGDSLWRISRVSYGEGRRYTVIFDANDSQIRNPDLIYPGQVFVLPKGSRADDAAARR